MVLVLLIAGGLLALGHFLGVPMRLRLVVLSILFALVALVQLTLPEGAALRAATGGSLRNWGYLLVVALLVGAYALVLRGLRARARPQAEAPPPGAPFSDSELERYARHIVLREIGGAGQQRLKAARVLVIGAGGLGSPVLQYLGAAGVGTIGVVDDDTVSLSNLQRQVLHGEDRIGMPKVFSAQIALKALNPHVTVLPYQRRLDAAAAADLFGEFDLILDGTDNFATRYLVNRAAVAAGKPLISGAISQWEGQLSLFDPASGAPCYACIFPEAPADGLAPSCAEAGVVGALPGVIGAMMALEAIKEITGAGQSLRGAMMIYDALYGENRRMRLERCEDCPVCAGARANAQDSGGAA